VEPTGGSIAAFIAAVTPARRQRDAETLIGLMRDITGREPVLWGTIIGFGSCHYCYPTGTEGDMPLLAFAPRKASTTIYVEDAQSHADDLAVLGAHTSSVSCLYVKDLDQIDETVLRRILETSAAATAAREGVMVTG
jgi:hypothetical protein